MSWSSSSPPSPWSSPRCLFRGEENRLGAFCHSPAVIKDLPGHDFLCQDDQGGHEDQVVQVAEPGQEIGDEVNGREGIADGEPEKDLGQARCASVF